VVVVSPFVTAKQESSSSVTTLAYDTIKHLSNVTFLQNQAITRGTSAAGAALVAYGSQPRSTGYISYLHNPTKSDLKLKTGKGFKPNTTHGLNYTKPYSRFGRSGVTGPATPKHGHYTQDHKSKSGQSKTPRKRSPRAVTAGKVLPVLGMGLVVANILGSQASGDSKALTFEKALGLPRANVSDQSFFDYHGKTIRRGVLIAKVLGSAL